MRHWLTRPDAPVDKRFLKRFTPDQWTVDFPRGAMASLVTRDAAHAVDVEARFLREGDLIGLIWDSEDRHSHPAQARETSRDYRGCVLSFQWQSEGLAGLDAVNGPTLTIEGRDENGAAKSWYVRLWNYASGSPGDARITLDFDRLDGGFLLPAEADRLFAGDIDRMFISLVTPDCVPGSSAFRAAPASGRVTLSDVRCDGPGSVITAGDAIAPENGFGICTAYDDMYNLAPSRAVEALVRSGLRGTINHYVGMSHYPTLAADGRVDATATLCAPALAWHRELARCAKLHGFSLIWSLSFELLDMFCPEAWKQRDWTAAPALTGYDPPSTLVSPANGEAIDYLGRVAAELVGLSDEAGLEPNFQVGEPWWWVAADGRICLYDAAAVAAFGGTPIEIGDVGGALDEPQKALLDQAGALLGEATASIVAAVPQASSHLLVYLPGLLDPERPEVKRANLPISWAKPAFDVLQIEEYEWVTSGRSALRSGARAEVEARLGYSRDEQHYLSGFVASAEAKDEWSAVIEAAGEARGLGVAETLLWAWPQVARDGLTLFGKEKDVQPFEDVIFPIAIGQEASIAPGFSTNVVTSASGHEYRNANWNQARLRFDAGPGVRSEAELGELIAFFRARRGPAVGFRFRDPLDHSSNGMTAAPGPTDQVLGEGDGLSTRFPLAKDYGGGEQRRVTRPVTGSVRVAVAGIERSTGWSLEPLGVVRFDTAPPDGAEVTAGFLFDVSVRFDDDRLEINRATFAAGDAPSVPLIEIREG